MRPRPWRRASAAASGLALGLTFTLILIADAAQAAQGGTALRGEAVPDWAVGNARCSGVLITPHAVLTSQQCLKQSQWTGAHHRKTDWSYGGADVWGAEALGPIGDIGLVLLTEPFGQGQPIDLAPVPSYRMEHTLLSDPPSDRSRVAADRSAGTPLVVYAADGVSRDYRRSARRLTAYLQRGKGPAPYPDAAPLTYRSLAWLRRWEPWWMGPQTGLFAPGLFDRLYTLPSEVGGLAWVDQDVDDQLIAFSGEDPAEGLVSPVGEDPADRGAGIFAVDGSGAEWLVGTVSGERLQPRLSAHWPWIVETLVQHGLTTDALALARAVLGTGDGIEADPLATEGDIHGRVDPVSGQLMFYRLVRRDESGGYGEFPNGAQSNAWWAVLGHQLPSRRQVLAAYGPSAWPWPLATPAAPITGASLDAAQASLPQSSPSSPPSSPPRASPSTAATREGAEASRRLSRPPGNAPAPPAPAAAR